MDASRAIRTAIVTGGDAEDVGAALQSIAEHVTTFSTVAELAAAVPDIAAGSVDLYIQLPVRVPTSGANAVEVVRNFLSEGLIRRFDAVSHMLPLLAPSATVALVTGNHPGSASAPDNPEARIALMKVLGHTLLVERGTASPGEDRVQVKVISGVPDAARLLEVVLEPQEHAVRVISQLAAAEPTLDYSDWRDAIMSLDETHA